MEIGLNNIKRFEFTDILGWSVSRYDKFMMCKRAYYYDYYGKYDQEFGRNRITALKAMTSVALETGNIVHDTVRVLLERLLKSDQPIDRARFTDYARRKTEEYCRAKTFSEVYYKELPGINTDAIFMGVEKSLFNFIDSPRYEWVTKKALTNKSGWVIEPPGFGETRINGMKAYCKVDFLFPVDDAIYILDWKTGKQDERKHKKQMIGYSTWASYHFGKDPASIVPMVVYLYPTYGEMQLTINEFDLQEFVIQVEKETKEMHGYCKAVEQNIPKGKEEFPMNERAGLCRFCNYRELCKRG